MPSHSTCPPQLVLSLADSSNVMMSRPSPPGWNIGLWSSGSMLTLSQARVWVMAEFSSMFPFRNERKNRVGSIHVRLGQFSPLFFVSQSYWFHYEFEYRPG